MKTVTIERTPTTFFIPADDLRAVYHCVSTEQSRYYIGGAFLTADETGTRLVGLDGNAMAVLELPEPAFVGEACMTQETGFILKTDPTDKAFKAKHSGGDLWIYGDTATGILQFVTFSGVTLGEQWPRVGVCEFEQIDGTFPPWQRVEATAKNRAPQQHIAFDPAVLLKLTKAGDVFGKRAIRFQPGATPGDPIRVEFASCSRLTGTLCAYRWDVL